MGSERGNNNPSQDQMRHLQLIFALFCLAVAVQSLSLGASNYGEACTLCVASATAFDDFDG
jgi:hypothetical protein